MKNHQLGSSSRSQMIGASTKRKTTRSTGNAEKIERNRILAGMGHKSSHAPSEDEHDDDPRSE